MDPWGNLVDDGPARAREEFDGEDADMLERSGDAQRSFAGLSNGRTAGLGYGSWWHSFVGNVQGNSGQMGGWIYEDPGDGSLHREYNWTLLKYGGNGQFSYEEDMYNPNEFGDMIQRYLAAKKAAAGG